MLQPRNEAGVGLIELLVVIVLSAVVGSIVLAAVVQTYGTTRRAQERVYALAELERSVERMSRELRVAAPSGTVAAVAPSGTAPGRDLTTQVFRGADRLQYRYRYDAASRTVTQTLATFSPAAAVTATSTVTNTLIGDVAQGTTPVFSYFDKNGAPVAAPQTAPRNIARIGITIVRDLPEQGAIRLETSVHLRNAVG